LPHKQPSAHNNVPHISVTALSMPVLVLVFSVAGLQDQ
jgi:hypothetical protein